MNFLPFFFTERKKYDIIEKKVCERRYNENGGVRKTGGSYAQQRIGRDVLGDDSIA